MHVPAGNMLFHGPREEVVPFFQSQGFFVPERKAVSDFLQEVTSKKDQKVSPDASYSCGSWVICLPSSLLCAAILQAQEQEEEEQEREEENQDALCVTLYQVLF